jgi:hypothetical protein
MGGPTSTNEKQNFTTIRPSEREVVAGRHARKDLFDITPIMLAFGAGGIPGVFLENSVLTLLGMLASGSIFALCNRSRRFRVLAFIKLCSQKLTSPR